MARILKDPGVGYKSNRNAQRLIINGSSNVKHINRARTIDDLYTYLINISWGLFLAYVLLGYVLINAIFGFVYLLIGVQEFQIVKGSLWEDFIHLFFFSAQTITTVGYGAIAPNGVWAGVISSLEALVGLMSFSFITGLLYGRFSKPKAKIKFSDHIVVRDFEDTRALMFRVMNKRTNMMIEPELNAIMSITEKNETGEFNRAFYQLNLERNKIMYLPTMWTLVHKMDKESPLYKYSKEELEALEVEIYILFQYHEETFNQKLYQLHSYDFSQLKIDYKFDVSYDFDEDGFTIIDHHKLNDIKKI
ncbi:ion transporter [Wenyingzhuangia fucanilytica]|uniref:Ion transporter n=1 Tax=Wenyingzhuangia fucanilytica TaxID=1790137 RepID=A0A1B1Y7N4_9FLAO|nr:ion channel [Wenyingzhuangia fucanilytica]ANW96790.1 ion transporter [Wenyingzhuangia fucanilytica]